MKSREFDKTMQQIRATMGAFGITLRDLQQAAGKAPRKTAARKGKIAGPGARKVALRQSARRPSVPKGAKLAAKYRGPKGETWSGRGLMPRWLAELVAQGKSRESFVIKG